MLSQLYSRHVVVSYVQDLQLVLCKILCNISNYLFFSFSFFSNGSDSSAIFPESNCLFRDSVANLVNLDCLYSLFLCAFGCFCLLIKIIFYYVTCNLWHWRVSDGVIRSGLSQIGVAWFVRFVLAQTRGFLVSRAAIEVRFGVCQSASLRLPFLRLL